VLRLLRDAGLPTGPCEELSGGVSSEIWKVGDVCVKRALGRLRVAQRWEAPVERNRYERLWLETAAAAAPGAAPRVLAADDGGGEHRGRQNRGQPASTIDVRMHRTMSRNAAKAHARMRVATASGKQEHERQQRLHACILRRLARAPKAVSHGVPLGRIGRRFDENSFTSRRVQLA